MFKKYFVIWIFLTGIYKFSKNTVIEKQMGEILIDRSSGCPGTGPLV